MKGLVALVVVLIGGTTAARVHVGPHEARMEVDAETLVAADSLAQRLLGARAQRGLRSAFDDQSSCTRRDVAFGHYTHEEQELHGL